MYFKGYRFSSAGLARMKEKKNTCRASVGRPKGKRRLGRPRCRWEDFKLILEEKDEGYGTEGSDSMI